MYILTQNKKTIIISNNITNIYIKESSFLIGDNKNTTSKKINIVNQRKNTDDKERHYYLYCNTVNNEKLILGLYSIERCNEILNDILLKLRDTKIYEMPKK